MTRAKPFAISKREVWEAFKKVKANGGAAGVDGQSIESLEARISANLRIPAQSGHRFRAKLDTDSGGKWTPIPDQSGQ